MKDFRRTGLAAVMIMAAATTATAQNEVEATVSADVVNQYIWRGTECGETSLQPTVGLAYKGISLTAWGSTELGDWGGAKEFDLTLGYGIGGLNIGVTDYWFSSGGDPEGRYFMYKSHSTNHVFEANIGYDFGPVAVQWYTNFAGNDGVKGDGKRAYSSYVEVSAPFKLGGLDWTAAVGASPLESTLYGNDGFAVTNVALKATKDIRITPSFSVPVFAGVVANPNTEKVYLLCGFTLKP